MKRDSLNGQVFTFVRVCVCVCVCVCDNVKWAIMIICRGIWHAAVYRF